MSSHYGRHREEGHGTPAPTHRGNLAPPANRRRLVAAYLGHADLSTVSRYAHVATDELHDAAAAITRNGALEPGLSRPVGRAIVDAATRREAGTARHSGNAGRPRRVVP